MEAERELLAGGKYREQDEIDEWRKRDPIDLLKRRLEASAKIKTPTLEDIERRTAHRVEQAAAFAEASEPADPELSADLMFVDHKA